MRILIVSDSYPPLIGGATIAAAQLGRQLAARGHDVTVATAWQRDAPSREDDHGVRVRRIRGLVSRVPALNADALRYTPPPFPDPEMVWRLRRLIRAHRPDVIHLYCWLSYSCVVATAGMSIPVLLAVRDYGNVCAVRTLVRQGRERGSRCTGPAWNKCHECAGAFYGQPKGFVAAGSVLGLRTLLRTRIDAVQSVSRFALAITQRFLLGPIQVPHEVLPDFLSLDDTPADAATLARLPPDPYILFVGSFRRIKGDELLLQAYARLADPPPLVMVGARTTESLPTFPAGVLALFDVPHSTVMAIWKRALFGVAPSVVPEGLGNVLHEGMSAGKAVIGTRPGGHEDIVTHGVDGLLVESGNVDELVRAMRRLIDEPDLRRRLERAAPAAIGRFSAASVVPRFEALYRCTIQAHGRKSH
jgi:glycosyltransferase involved in cell wall biosynthesis